MTCTTSCRASSIPIFSYFLTKFLFFREIPVFFLYFGHFALFLVFYSLFITIISHKNIPGIFSASLHSASKYFFLKSCYNPHVPPISPPLVMTAKVSLTDKRRWQVVIVLNVKEILKISQEITETLWIFSQCREIGTLLRYR